VKKSLPVLFLIWLLFWLFWYRTACSVAEEIRFVDDTGKVVQLSKPAQRVVPLYGAFLEMLFAIGAGHHVVARTKADAYFEPALSLPSVGTHMKPNVELIISLQPDLVIATVAQERRCPELARIADAGIPVAAFAPKNFEMIFNTMKRLGIAVGMLEEAETTVNNLRKKLKNVRSHAARLGRKYTVFYEVRKSPLTAAGRASIVNEILSVAGLVNIVDVNKKLVQYSVEALLAKDPDFYIVQRGPMNPHPGSLDKRPHFRLLRAVREGRIIVVDEFLFSRPGPRCVKAAELLVSEIYKRLPDMKAAASR